MKKVLALLLLCSILFPCIHATSLNFQNPGDTLYCVIQNDTYGGGVTGYITWTQSTSAGNNYMRVNHYLGNTWSVAKMNGSSQTSYAAATVGPAYSKGGTGYAAVYVTIYDGTGTIVDALTNTTSAHTSGNAAGRWEVKVSGGYADLYHDGVWTDRSAALAANPYNVGWGIKPVSGNDALAYFEFDDIVYGQSESKYVAGLPESADGADNQVIIYKDILNSATNGTAYKANYSIINSNYMYGNWARGVGASPPNSTLDNETIQLVNYMSGKVIATNYTGTSAYYGTLAWDLLPILFDAGEPQGFYAIYWPGQATYSNIIEYTSNGASVAWSSHSYSIGDTGSVIYFVLDGGYWSSDYSYKLSVLDVYGNFKENTTITTQTGTITHEWLADEYDEGVYYAWLIATDSDGVEYILGGDYTTLYAQALLYGWVMEDKTGNTISGALINCTYDSSWENTSTSASGNYTTTAVFMSGTTPSCNVSATGYQTYWWNASLLSGASKLVNFTLQSDTHSNLGLAAGGVDRDNLYKNPIPDKYIELVNTSNSESYNTTTNIAGWWMVDNLTSGRLYCATGYKSGYTNTTRCETVI